MKGKNIIKIIKLTLVDDSRIYSNSVEVFGLDWRIMWYNSEQSSHYGCYLDCVSASYLGKNLEKSLHFTITLKNVETDLDESRQGYNNFEVNAQDSGWSMFIAKSKVDEEESGFILDGMLTFEVEFNVYVISIFYLFSILL
jgi:hypothetical protein